MARSFIYKHLYLCLVRAPPGAIEAEAEASRAEAIAAAGRIPTAADAASGAATPDPSAGVEAEGPVRVRVQLIGHARNNM